MTYREKFVSVFGVDPSEVDDWDAIFHRGKPKLYKVIMRRRFETEAKEQFFVKAHNKKSAREKAIQQLGHKYTRFSPSGSPIYALDIIEQTDCPWK